MELKIGKKSQEIKKEKVKKANLKQEKSIQLRMLYKN